jgi:hypothetical protein
MGIIFLLVSGQLQDNQLSETKGINPPMIFLAAWCVLFGMVPGFMINSPYRRLEAEAASRKREVESMVEVATEAAEDK